MRCGQPDRKKQSEQTDRELSIVDWAFKAQMAFVCCLRPDEMKFYKLCLICAAQAQNNSATKQLKLHAERNANAKSNLNSNAKSKFKCCAFEHEMSCFRIDMPAVCQCECGRRVEGCGRQLCGVSRFVCHKFRIIARVFVHRCSCISVNKNLNAQSKKSEERNKNSMQRQQTELQQQQELQQQHRKKEKHTERHLMGNMAYA